MSGRGGRAHAPGRRAPDPGATFVELLVAIVLLGTVVVATLAGLRAAVIASTVDEDQSRAYAWLQSAADAIERAPYTPCHTVPSNAVLVAGYQSVVDGAARPAEWTVPSGATIVVESIDYLSRAGGVEGWGPDCASDDALSPVFPQRVRLRVTTPDGESTATLQVIKSV